MISKQEERDARCLPVIQKPIIARIPELYPENLETLRKLVDMMPALASVDGVWEVELRVRVDDVDVWAVIGYGESGDPCVLRFESEPKPPTPVKRGEVFTTTINKADKLCSCGEWAGPSGKCGPNGCYNVPA